MRLFFCTTLCFNFLRSYQKGLEGAIGSQLDLSKKEDNFEGKSFIFKKKEKIGTVGSACTSLSGRPSAVQLVAVFVRCKKETKELEYEMHPPLSSPFDISHSYVHSFTAS
uniref:Uncharacterized protein n=1 Tax=Micrurus surinamensis TaxID=129470 RepID=A0A2D4P8A7_MICSU